MMATATGYDAGNGRPAESLLALSSDGPATLCHVQLLSLDKCF